MQHSNGVLISGQSGSGKTALVRGVLALLHPLYSQEVDAASLVEQMEKDVNTNRTDGETRNVVGRIMDNLVRNQPAVLFIDRLDLVGHTPKSSESLTVTKLRSCLQQEMDRLSGQRAGVLVVAAVTNPEALVPALRRNGRFDREIALRKPDAQGREALLRSLTAAAKLHVDVDFASLASRSEGLNPSDLEGWTREAALGAIRRYLAKKEFEETVAPTIAASALQFSAGRPPLTTLSTTPTSETANPPVNPTSAPAQTTGPTQAPSMQNMPVTPSGPVARATPGGLMDAWLVNSEPPRAPQAAVSRGSELLRGTGREVRKLTSS